MNAPAHHAALQTLVARRLGLRLEARQLPWLLEALCRQAQAPVETALQRLDTEPALLEALLPELTVGETCFFRHAEQFRALRLQVLPALLRARRETRRLRVLSAGCASGEEAYSLAICVAAQLGLEREAWDWQVLGLDLNPEALRRAEAARYGAWSLRELPEAARAPWFEREGEELRPLAALRPHLRFERRSLSEPDALFWQAGSFDLIFCRNVLMYLLPEALQRAQQQLAQSLAPDGYLFLGHAESLRAAELGLALRQEPGCFYYQRATEPAFQPTQPPQPPRPAAPLAPRRSAAAPQPALQALLREERHAEALALAAQLAERHPRDPQPRLHHALLLAQQGRLDEALRDCERLLALAPGAAQRAAAHYVQALCLEARGDRAGAALRYRQAARLDTGFAMPRLRLGLLARRAGDAALMREELRTAAELLRREDEQRLLLFGGGFGRATLLSLCEDELRGALA